MAITKKYKRILSDLIIEDAECGFAATKLLF